jgi:L-alanine-DL-glutamate epimerase-like enolase superfamily enzyme
MGVYFLEEPLSRFDFDRLAELNRLFEMKIAGGQANRGLPLAPGEGLFRRRAA